MRAVIALKAEHRLEVLLDVAGLARSTFFYHQSRLQRPDPRASLKTAVTEIFEKSHGRYGHRRIHIELLKQGWTIAKKTVLKLMRSLRLVCKVRSRKRYSSYQGEQGIVAPNLLKRQFEADAPNQKWVTDVTEFSVGVRFLNTDALETALHEYIRWYNTERVSTKLRGLSPAQYRAQTLAA